MQDEKQRALLDAYFKHTREILPALGSERGWSAWEESHFQRLILDQVVGGVWYGKLREPAVLHLSKSQLRKAVRLAEGLADGSLDFAELNAESEAWREAEGKPLPAGEAPEAEEEAPRGPSAMILQFPR